MTPIEGIDSYSQWFVETNFLLFKMERQRTVSDSCGGVRSISRKVSSLTLAATSEPHKLQSTSVPSKLNIESSKAALMKVLGDYKFIGKIITWKPQEEYGFIR